MMSEIQFFNPQTQYFTDYEQMVSCVSNMEYIEKKEFINTADKKSLVESDQISGGTIGFDISSISQYLTKDCLTSKDLLCDAIRYLNPVILKMNDVDVAKYYAVTISLLVNELKNSCCISYIIHNSPLRKVQQLPDGYHGELAEKKVMAMSQSEKDSIFGSDAKIYHWQQVSGWGY